jgi:SAM-dependent methyltransferase
MMSKINIFDNYAEEYDTWFDNHPWVYQSEVQAVKMLLPPASKGVEIGVGTGRFAVPFGIKIGVEPSGAMAEIARSRGITVYDAEAEKLPFGDCAFDFALMVTTICFLDAPLQAFKEIRRILRPAGKIIIGMLDKNSPLGRTYESQKKNSKFYQHANFYSVDQVLEWLTHSGYYHLQSFQTITTNPEDIKDMAPTKEGHGEGLFAVISAIKKKHFAVKGSDHH